MKRLEIHAGPVVRAALTLLIALTPSLPNAQTTNAATLEVRVTNARNATGIIRVALFSSADGFPGDTSKAVRVQGAQIDSKTLSSDIIFTGLPSGIYAVSLFHDENTNGRLDKNFIGIPKEGYGASNNPKKKMGPPRFDESSFSLSSDQSVEIKLIY
jgi:uncharacterized protein (DUF2141 family)